MDKNGSVDINDITALKAAIVEGYDDEQLAAGDIDNSTKLDINDITALKALIMSKA